MSEVYGFAVFIDFFHDICAVLRFELACDLHFFPISGAVFFLQFLAILSCGFAVSIDVKHSRRFLV